MRRVIITLAILGWSVAAGGCSITGSWKLLDTDPPGVPFPVDVVTFDRDHNYTATEPGGAEARTTTGQYRWNGSRLDIMQPGMQPRTYRAKRRLDGRLILTYTEGGNKVTAILGKDPTD